MIGFVVLCLVYLCLVIKELDVLWDKCVDRVYLERRVLVLNFIELLVLIGVF